MKILLINPPDQCMPGDEYFAMFPLGLGYLAAVLEKEGHDVHVLDAQIEKQESVLVDNFYHIGLEWDEIKRRVEKINPDFVGISCLFTSQAKQMHKTAEVVKSIKDIPVVVGGVHATALYKEVMEDKNIDYIILGEGEISLSQLVKGEDKKKRDGLVYRKNKQIKINPKTKFIEDLDSLPYPARNLFPMDKYLHSSRNHATFCKRTPVATVLTSRGCPYDCIFCSIHGVCGYKWRSRDPYKIVDEIEFLVENYHVKEIHFEDDNMTLDKNRAEIICDEIIRRKLDISWTTPNGVRIDTLDEDLLNKMKKSGCYLLFIGVESGSQYVLDKLINKKLSLKKVERINKLIQKVGIERIAFFVIGTPGETKENIKESIRFMIKLDLDDIFLSIVSPYPGSRLYKESIKNNWLVNTDLSKIRPKYCNIKTKYLTPEEVERLRNIMYLKHTIVKFVKHPCKLISKRQLNKIKRYIKFLFGRGV